MSWHFSGLFTALVTPFTEAGEIDWQALDRLLSKQLAGGVDGIVVLGTTGECPTVHGEETEALFRHVRERVGGTVQVIGGVSGNDTALSVAQARQVEATGVDGLLVTCPYYNKPTQAGLLLHHRAVAEAVSCPVVLYNIKGRTAVNIEAETLVRLAEIPNIVGAKEASTDMAHILSLMAAVPEDFAVLSGNDDMALPIMALGGAGVICTLSNLLPAAMKRLVEAGLDGDWETARGEHNRLLPLMRGCGLETNPIPIKTALAWRGDIAPVFRAPMCEMTEAPATEWRLRLEEHGILDDVVQDEAA